MAFHGGNLEERFFKVLELTDTLRQMCETEEDLKKFMITTEIARYGSRGKVNDESSKNSGTDDSACNDSLDLEEHDSDDGAHAHEYGATVSHVSDADFAASIPRFVFAKLDWLRKNCLITYETNQRQIIITPTSAHGVFLSDSLLSLETRAAFIVHAKPLELASVAAGKWHAGTDGKAFDLIHSSDYCLVYGRSMARNSHCQKRPAKKVVLKLSTHFQWLSTEFIVSGTESGEDGSTLSSNYSVRVCSYINNSHRASFPKLHTDIKSIIVALIPRTTNNAYQGRFKFRGLRSRPIAVPGLPKEFTPPPQTDKLYRFPLKDHTIKVITKMADIHMTHETPQYGGGSWHLEETADTNEEALFKYEDHDFAGLKKLIYKHGGR
ncbi:hypothetical protein HK100_009380 [Physocladia obscura]|uniref:DUF4246 domain-containing protein n=1 Tax=Physocladia obscura TaxID=109957 RepID=A0AAD5TBT8_9FUNG|nr:hypothetical protein HK100_009380 [Physocladia obscura]